MSRAMFAVLFPMLKIVFSCGDTSDAECVEDEDCAVERWEIDAELHCEEAVESKARYSVNWTSGFLGDKFNYVWRSDGNFFRMYGNKVEFSDRHGVYYQRSYTCHYDPILESVTYISVK